MGAANPNLKYWLGFSKTYSIGTVSLRRMLEHFGSIEQCWHASAGDLLRIEGVAPAVIEKLQNEKKKLPPLEKLEEKILNSDIQVLTLEDENYPAKLKEIYDPPFVLYVKGSFERHNPERSLAIVGSRRASTSIKVTLKKIIGELKGTDITIISGLAEGVDGCAHWAAIENGLPTIAALGSGFDHLFPPSHKDLFARIIDGNGAVITEYFPDTQPQVYTFPRRNRIISGLSQGTLVAEAGLKSGALITARLCLEQGRELMCIPGDINNSNTNGVYKLIKDGAAVVTEAQDILNTLRWDNISKNEQAKNKNTIKLLDNEKQIYDILDLEPKSFDVLAAETKMNADDLLATLSMMEVKGIITQLPGQKFMKSII